MPSHNARGCVSRETLIPITVLLLSKVKGDFILFSPSEESTYFKNFKKVRLQ